MRIKLYSKTYYRKKSIFEFYCGQSVLIGNYTTKEIERFAIGILKAIKSKKLKY